MKKLFLTINLFLSVIMLAQAQNTSPYWSLSGNSNATSTSKLGTTNAINLRLFTNNLERMRITSAGLVGVGTNAPNAKLHINSATGQSPFRVQVNGNTKLLVHSSGGLAIGANATPPSDGLYVSGNVGIGISSTSYKLHVVGSTFITEGLYVGNGGIFSYNGSGAGVSGSGSGYGLYGTTTGTYGVYGVSNSSTGGIGVYGTGSGYGVHGYSVNSTGVFGSGSYGVYGRGTNTGIYGVGSVYGIAGFSSSGKGVDGYSSTNIAGNFYSSASHGIWAQTGSTANGVYAGVFQGNVFTYNAYQTSDKNLKKNIQEVGEAMSLINKLKPKQYEFRDDGKYASLQLPKGNHYGLLAQDLEQVLPNLVNETPLVINTGAKVINEPKVISSTAGGAPTDVSEAQTVNQQVPTEILHSKAVNYTELIPIVIKGMQEQQQTIQEQKQIILQLQQENNAFKERFAKLEAALGAGRNNLNNLFNSANLEQNKPNPFNESTTFRYNIPAGANAQILVYDAAGKLVKTLVAPANGQVQMNAYGLKSGTYVYSLMVNGKLAASKQMVVSK